MSGFRATSTAIRSEFSMTALVQLCRQLTGRALVPRHVGFMHHRDDDPSELSAFFGGDVKFGMRADRLTFDAAVRNLHVLSADPYLNELLIANGEEALARRAAQRGSFRSQVENAMVPRLPHGAARAGEIAGALGVSQRTLARRLAAAGDILGSAEIIAWRPGAKVSRRGQPHHLAGRLAARLPGGQRVRARVQAVDRHGAARGARARAAVTIDRAA